MVSCKECGSEVSEKAIDCPNCGAHLRTPKRGFFGKLIKWTFIGFNILMLIWVISGIGASSEGIESASSEAGEAGAAIGAGIGLAMIITVWAIGDVILGIMTLLSRPKR